MPPFPKTHDIRLSYRCRQRVHARTHTRQRERKGEKDEEEMGKGEVGRERSVREEGDGGGTPRILAINGNSPQRREW